MSTATSISKLGFRRWHERQLIEAHASLVTAFLAMIAVAVCIEQLHWREGGFKPVILLLLIVAGIVLCFKAVTFYFRVLFRAEHYAAQAVCGNCKAYGMIDVTTASVPDTGSGRLKVRCKQCGHEWTLAAQTVHTPASKPM